MAWSSTGHAIPILWWSKLYLRENGFITTVCLLSTPAATTTDKHNPTCALPIPRHHGEQFARIALWEKRSMGMGGRNKNCPGTFEVMGRREERGCNLELQASRSYSWMVLVQCRLVFSYLQCTVLSVDNVLSLQSFSLGENLVSSPNPILREAGESHNERAIHTHLHA